MKKIEHIGIAVKNLNNATLLYERLLGVSHYKMEEVPSEGVITSFFKLGESKVELLQGLNDNSPIAKFVNKNGEGIHHVAFEVGDINAEIKRLKKEGFEVLNDVPKKGADNKWVAFLHPKSCHGVLIELCQDLGKEN